MDFKKLEGTLSKIHIIYAYTADTVHVNHGVQGHLTNHQVNLFPYNSKIIIELVMNW